MADLVQLQQEIAARTSAIAEAHGDWPCRKGCGACCRRLAAPLRLTKPERTLLEAGIALLPAAVRERVERRFREMPAVPPIVCPLLDDAGACLVYEHRPIACRTYGFYRERDLGLYCEEIRVRVDAGEFDRVIWGNAAAIEYRLREFGEPK